MRPIILGDNNMIEPTTTGIVVVGNDNQVSGQFSKTAFINCHELDLTNEDDQYDGHTLINDGAVHIDADGLTGAAIKRRRATITGTGNTISSTDGISLYFLDASAGNVAVTVEHSDLDRIFVRKDATANTAIITPSTGNINGATSYNVATQYQKITVVSDGTDLYF